MWKQLIDFGSKLFALMRRTQNLEDGAKAQSEEMQDLRQINIELNHKVEDLTDVVQALGFELQRERDNRERDAEIQRLTLENMLLRYERGLPQGDRRDEDPE